MDGRHSVLSSGVEVAAGLVDEVLEHVEVAFLGGKVHRRHSVFHPRVGTARGGRYDQCKTCIELEKCLKDSLRLNCTKKRQQDTSTYHHSEASTRIIDQGRDFDGFQQRGTLKEIIYDKTSSLSGKETCG